MSHYIMRRMLALIPTLIFASVIVFATRSGERSKDIMVASGAPRGPVSEDVGCTPERAELHVENEFSTDKPETDHARGYQSIRGS